MLKRSIDIRIFGLAFIVVVFFSIFLLHKTFAIGGLYSLTGSGARGWYGIDTSADGTKVIAADQSGYIYISTDSGATWNPQIGNGITYTGWYAAVDVTPDGTKFAAASASGYIYYSSNGGTSWMQLTNAGSRNWYGIVLSDDGVNMTASSDGVFTSTDSGANWLRRSGPVGQWLDVATSSDGQKILSTCNGCIPQLSSNGGVSWTALNDLGPLGWRSFTVSPDGMHLGAASPDGPIFTSDDGGTIWVDHTSALNGAIDWLSLAASSDGQHLAAAIYSGGDIWTSDDGGTTWADNNFVPANNWYAVTLSADGTKLYATANGDYIYSSVLPNVAPVASVVSISGTFAYNQLLTGNYTYTDADNDTEGTSTYRWLRDDVAIDGATSTTYTTVLADVGHTLKFEVTPVASVGTTPGVAVESAGDDIVVVVPSITTGSSSSITQTLATLSGNITDTGGEDATSRGVYYGLTDSYGSNVTENSTTYTIGEFSENITGLICNTTYHYQVFAINSAGTGLGSDQTFTTSNCPVSGHPPAPPAPAPAPTPTPTPTPEPAPTPTPEPPVPTPKTEVPKKVIDVPKTVIKDPIIKVVVEPSPTPTVSENPGSNIVSTTSNTSTSSVNGGTPQDSNKNNVDNIINRAISKLTGKNVVLSLSETKKNTKALIETPTGQIVTEFVPVVGAVSGVAVSVAAGMFANPLTMSEIFLIPIRLWAILMTALGLKKRNRPWGTVYDSVTKQPLDPAYVVLLDQQGKEVATSITDLDGRYGFLIGPGTYHLVASKTNYTFPSAKLKGENIDELYNDLYFGTDVVVTTEGEVIGKNIPLDANGFDWNEYTKKEQKLTKFYSNRQKVIAYISNILFSVGLLVTITAVLVAPTSYNVGTLVLYLVLFILKRTILRPKPQGSVTDKETNAPLSFAIVRIYSASTNREILHKVTDKTGKYYCLIPNGTYYATVERKNSDATYTKVFTSESVEVTGGYFKGKFTV